MSVKFLFNVQILGIPVRDMGYSTVGKQVVRDMG